MRRVYHRRFRRKYRRMKYYATPLEKRIVFCAIVSLITIIIFILLIDARVRPVLKTIAANNATNIAVQAINNAVEETMENKEFDYNDMVTFIYDNDHKIAAIKSNIGNVNTLDSKIEDAVMNKINSTEKKKIRIPIGTILGGDLLTGRGPKISLYINLSGTSAGNILNHFESAGINQTRHQIQMEITIKMHIIMSGTSTSTTVTQNIILAETILVGVVPDAYADINK